MKEHDLKVWPGYFDALECGEKPFELRLNDRDFRAGDTLLLREWSPQTKEYTGRQVRRVVTYCIEGGPWLHEGHVCMGLRNEDRAPAPGGRG